MIWREKQCKSSIKINSKSFQTNLEVMQLVNTKLQTQYYLHGNVSYCG